MNLGKVRPLLGYKIGPLKMRIITEAESAESADTTSTSIETEQIADILNIMLIRHKLVLNNLETSPNLTISCLFQCYDSDFG